LELFFNSGGLFAKLWAVGQFQRNRGASLQNSQNNRFPDLIFNRKFRGPSPRCGGPQTEGTVAPRRRAARKRWSSPVLTSDGGGGRAGRGGAREVLTSDRGVATRRRTRGSERWRLELFVREKEGAKQLRREGMRCGEIRGSHRPFIGSGGAPERGGLGGVTAALMALTPLKTGARLRGRLRGGG
jgi:hypothetical protein